MKLVGMVLTGGSAQCGGLQEMRPRPLVQVTSEAVAVVVAAGLHDVTELVSHHGCAGAVAAGDAGMLQG